MNYQKLFLKMIRRDELLLEAERNWRGTCTNPEEVFLKAARLTAEIAELIDEEAGRPQTLSAGIQRDLALFLFYRGGILKKDKSEYHAYKEAVDNQFRSDLEEQLDRIDRGEEETIPFEEAKKRILGDKGED